MTPITSEIRKKITYLYIKSKHEFNVVCQSIHGSRPDGTTLRRGVMYVTLTMGIFQEKGLFLIQSHQKHVPMDVAE
jgi:hypothetical protein